MQWAERPTCHDADPWAKRQQHVSRWRPVEPPKGDERSTPFRTCSFCGSIHPEDLLCLVADVPLTRAVTPIPGPALELPNAEIADMKYGYPHKLYFDELPNPNADHVFVCGYTIEGGVKKDIQRMPEGNCRAKFYTAHFFDEGLDDEALKALCDMIALRTRTRLIIDRDAFRISWHAERMASA